MREGQPVLCEHRRPGMYKFLSQLDLLRDGTLAIPDLQAALEAYNTITEAAAEHGQFLITVDPTGTGQQDPTVPMTTSGTSGPPIRRQV
jgi:hypothetical protein